MSLAEIEKEVRELPAPEREQFVSWVFAHEEELTEHASLGAIAPEVMEELLLRRKELDNPNLKTYNLAELKAGMEDAIDEVRRSRN